MTAKNLTTEKMDGFKEYAKTATIQAVQVSTSFIIDTLEGTFIGKAGDWLAEEIEGERSIIDNTVFKKTYREV